MVVVLDDLIVIVQLSFCCLLFLLLDVFLYTDNFFYENSDSSLCLASHYFSTEGRSPHKKRVEIMEEKLSKEHNFSSYRTV